MPWQSTSRASRQEPARSRQAASSRRSSAALPPTEGLRPLQPPRGQRPGSRRFARGSSSSSRSCSGSYYSVSRSPSQPHAATPRVHREAPSPLIATGQFAAELDNERKKKQAQHAVRQTVVSSTPCDSSPVAATLQQAVRPPAAMQTSRLSVDTGPIIGSTVVVEFKQQVKSPQKPPRAVQAATSKARPPRRVCSPPRQESRHRRASLSARSRARTPSRSRSCRPAPSPRRSRSYSPARHVSRPRRTWDASPSRPRLRSRSDRHRQLGRPRPELRPRSREVPRQQCRQPQWAQRPLSPSPDQYLEPSWTRQPLSPSPDRYLEPSYSRALCTSAALATAPWKSAPWKLEVVNGQPSKKQKKKAKELHKNFVKEDGQVDKVSLEKEETHVDKVPEVAAQQQREQGHRAVGPLAIPELLRAVAQLMDSSLRPLQ
mmetsp:Transcript_16623/g.46020  ORF Transcript_16623/g.46020 Transcript_16623/m.46020 type:complete len:431 (-) Transcript_16623:890-2182(-)